MTAEKRQKLAPIPKQPPLYSVIYKPQSQAQKTIQKYHPLSDQAKPNWLCCPYRNQHHPTLAKVKTHLELGLRRRVGGNLLVHAVDMLPKGPRRLGALELEPVSFYVSNRIHGMSNYR